MGFEMVLKLSSQSFRLSDGNKRRELITRVIGLFGLFRCG